MASPETGFRIIFVVSVSCLVIGVVGLLRTASFVLSAEPANAVVVTASSRGDGQYRLFKGYPEVVQFSDLNGIVHTPTVYYGQPGRHPPGTAVKVLYKQLDPAGTARYGHFGQLWVLPGCVTLMGAMFLFAAFVVRNRVY
ncbi:DUF3592 domain-containing protein [Pyxidicoccus caerfyrddinensis]|uniref:DUF3592 domain-containing protein n=1 Tax=Pyxidicoccus caerfyrddinensis TaxID=2709663 RepID=UPI0013DAAC29|nr:DUF3592 domain-containing protein [Pyxidicoccus caerfyrddinensis]